MGKDVWRRGVPLQRKELPIKASQSWLLWPQPACCRKPLPRADTSQPLVGTKTVAGETLGTAPLGTCQGLSPGTSSASLGAQRPRFLRPGKGESVHPITQGLPDVPLAFLVPVRCGFITLKTRVLFRPPVTECFAACDPMYPNYFLPAFFYCIWC